MLTAVAGLAQEKGYVAPETCRTCHSEIFAKYAATGMGRSFAPIASAPVIENWNATFTHKQSGRVYTVFRRDGGFFMRRTLADGSLAIEKQIHYVIGSGNHSRTYLTRKKNGKLAELPLSWYSENGGYWAMSPGYDRPDHSDFRREVSDSCLFCHNGYPSEANGGTAAGIDCQRCHGPGEEHVLRQGKIVNPARLSPERRAEICLQCHLESASRHIPDSIRRFDRGPYSYRPGEPLGAFTIYFDRAASGAEDSITVNHSAYGMRQSQCFEKGKLDCTTCHNPHHAPRGAEAKAHYQAACQQCHAKTHPERGDCIECHMPKRRADDAVHVVITDHWIRRNPPRSDLKAKVEKHGRYAGPVKLLYPMDARPDPLYLALGALTDKTRLTEAESIVLAAQPDLPQFYTRLADVFRDVRNADKARRYYREALRRKPDDVAAASALADLLIARGEVREAIAVLERAVALAPYDPMLLNALSVAYGRASRFGEAEGLLRRALDADDELPLTWLNLGVAMHAQGRSEEASRAYREALRLQPDLERARVFLGQVGR